MPTKSLKGLIEETRSYYDSIGRVHCKILNSDVHFSSEGKQHLLYKGNRKKRSVKEQRHKLTLFPLVIPVIKNATEIQGWRFADNPAQKDVQHYSLVYEAGKRRGLRVRVIIKRTGDGQFNYYSVMLHSRNTKKPRTKRDS